MSNVLVGLLAALLFGGWAYIKDLQAKAESCEARARLQSQLNQLTDQVVGRIKDEKNERIDSISDAAANDDCAAVRAPDAVINALRK